MPELKDKIAVVTGASRGIGRGIALVLGEAGALVYVTGRSIQGANTTENLPGTIHATAEEITARGGLGVPVRCDHTIDTEVAALFDRVRQENGRLDILVNNVWGGYEQYDFNTFDVVFWKQPLERWQRMFTAGVRTHFTASYYAAPLMLPQRRGLIVNISAGDHQKYLGNVIYDTAKAAIDRLAFGMARDLRSYNIAALALYPGFTRTERVLSAYKGDLSITESPEYTGRAVAALAADPDVLQKSGGTYRVGDLAREYDFTDIDGRQVPPFTIEELR